MSFKKNISLGIVVVISVLSFTCLIKSNTSLDKDLISYVRTASANNNWHYNPSTAKEAHDQFVVETLLLRCEKRCDLYKYSLIEELPRTCRDTCYEIWAFFSRAKEAGIKNQ